VALEPFHRRWRSRIKHLIVAAFAAAFLCTTAGNVEAALTDGATAPTFKTKASLGGKVFEFDLAAALKKGPVVLYFFPAAFTTGCTIEAHDFAAHIADYKKLHATVIGISGDAIAKLNRFSKSECRSKFAVGADPDLAIAKAFDAVLRGKDRDFADRISYVIAPNGKIAYVYSSLEPDDHVANTLAALKALQKKDRPIPGDAETKTP